VKGKPSPLISRYFCFYVMPSSITKDIWVNVETSYQEINSRPEDEHFVFTYRITIKNNSEQTVQLMRRQWNVFDSNLQKHRVEGEGVIGRQPILEPGQSHEYVSGCNLETDLGKMRGRYLMRNLIDDSEFYVDVPEFIMMAPFRKN